MPGPALGSNVVFGTSEEVTYGTPVAADRYYELLSESLERENRILVSNGLRAGTIGLRRGSRRVPSARMGSGDINMEVATTGFGRWFKHMLGGTPTIVQQGATTAWLQTHTMGSLFGRSMTVVKALRDEASTEIETFNYHGGKVTAWEFSISVDQILQLSVTMDFEDVDVATAMPAASYTTTKLFHFAQGSLTVAGGSVAAVTNATVGGENPMNVNRFYLGSNGLKKEPAPNDFRAITGSLTAEFNTPADFYNRFAADSAAALVLTFTGDNISGAFNEQLTITVPDVRFTGGTPTVPGPDVIVQDVPFEGAFDGTNPGATITLMSTDVAV